MLRMPRCSPTHAHICASFHCAPVENSCLHDPSSLPYPTSAPCPTSPHPILVGFRPRLFLQDLRAPLLKDFSSVARTWEYCSSGRLLLDWASSEFIDGGVGRGRVGCCKRCVCAHRAWSVPRPQLQQAAQAKSKTCCHHTLTSLPAWLALPSLSWVQPSNPQTDPAPSLHAAPCFACLQWTWAAPTAPSAPPLTGCTAIKRTRPKPKTT